MAGEFYILLSKIQSEIMFSVLLLKFLKIQMKKSEDHIEIKLKKSFKVHTKHYYKNHVILYITREKYWETVQPRPMALSLDSRILLLVMIF